LIGGQNAGQVIHSNLQQALRFTGSTAVSADEGLWINLWKLWIAGDCCHRCPGAIADGGVGARSRGPDSMGRMDDVEVKQAEIADVPSTFDQSVALLDVREDDEWQRGHAPGAQHIPMGQIPARLGELDPDAQLFVVCHLGGRSQRVSQYLARNGYKPVNVAGGMQAWSEAGRPVITDDGDNGAV
jgi:rhodanese-related sulfurtransferase